MLPVDVGLFDAHGAVECRDDEDGLADLLRLADEGLPVLQHDFVRSCMGPFCSIDRAVLTSLVKEMTDEGETQLTKEGANGVRHQLALDLRYLKQYHEVTVPIALDDLLAGDSDAMAEAFHQAHDQLYGYNLKETGTGLELINIRVRSVGLTESLDLPRHQRGSADATHALKGTRRAWVFDHQAFELVPVYDGHALLSGNRLNGPALIERTDTTIFVSGGFDAEVDDLGSVVLQRKEVTQ